MTPSYAADDDPPDDHDTHHPPTEARALTPPVDVAPELHDEPDTEP
jgi:hypothetical protein